MFYLTARLTDGQFFDNETKSVKSRLSVQKPFCCLLINGIDQHNLLPGMLKAIDDIFVVCLQTIFRTVCINHARPERLRGLFHGYIVPSVLTP